MEDELPSRWTALDRARHDVASGRLWKARDRLNGLLTHGSVDAYELLADVYFAMRDLPQAGKLWYLTGRDDAQALEAIEAWRSRCGNKPSAMLRSIKLAPSTSIAQARIEDLRREVSSKEPRSAVPLNGVRESFRERIWWACFFGFVLVFTIGIWIVGIASIIWFLTR